MLPDGTGGLLIRKTCFDGSSVPCVSLPAESGCAHHTGSVGCYWAVL